jgi:hypothetical protein
MAVQTPAEAPARKQTGFNRFLARWLASPFGVLSGRVVLVRYVGRVSGLPRQLPVNCQPFEGGYLIRVGKPEEKKWWRNFRSPWPVELVRGRVISGTAVVALGETAEGLRLASDYFDEHPGAARRAGLPKAHKGDEVDSELLRAAAAKLVFVVVHIGR